MQLNELLKPDEEIKTLPSPLSREDATYILRRSWRRLRAVLGIWQLRSCSGVPLTSLEKQTYVTQFLTQLAGLPFPIVKEVNRGFYEEQIDKRLRLAFQCVNLAAGDPEVSLDNLIEVMYQTCQDFFKEIYEIIKAPGTTEPL